MISERKKILLNKVNDLIDKKKNELLKLLPSIHKIDDGIVIRSFIDWDSCDEDNSVKYRRIHNINRVNEIIFFYYLPKNTILEIKKCDCINSITCLSGSIEIDTKKETFFLESYNKISLNDTEFCGKTLDNTYLITTIMA